MSSFKQSSWYIYGKVFVKIGFHYSDLITDILLIVTIFQISSELEETKGVQA